MTEMVTWCSVCSAEQAITVVDIEMNGEWIPWDIGPACLTRLQSEGRMDT